MPVVQPFTRRMIDEAIRFHKWTAVPEDDGEIKVDWGYYEKGACHFLFYLYQQGDQNEIFTVRCTPLKTIPRPNWPKATHVCNAWNRLHNWPTAYLNPIESSGNGFIMLRQSIDLEKGIHQDLLNQFSIQAAGNGLAFCRWVHTEHNWCESGGVAEPGEHFRMPGW